MAEDNVIDSLAERGSWPKTVVVAVLATLLATGLRAMLTPLIGASAEAFSTFFPAVLFSSWYYGFRAGVLCVLFSALSAAYFFVSPANSLWITNRVDQITSVIFGVVGFGTALLSRSQQKALERAEEEQSLRVRITRQLATIVDTTDEAILSKDTDGQLDFKRPSR